MDVVNQVLTHPEIWKDIAPEGVEPFNAPYRPDVVYLMADKGDGVITFHRYKDGLKIHPNFLPSKSYTTTRPRCRID